MKECKGCWLTKQVGVAPGPDTPPGGVVRMGDHWLLNHYNGEEGYLGWMALQPMAHRMSIGDQEDLNEEECGAMGKCIKRVEQLLRGYWQENFEDRIVRVYVVYFFESVFNRPSPSPYHLHMHLIPRFCKLDGLLRECTEGKSGFVSSVNAWRTPGLTRLAGFPNEYRRNDAQYAHLVNWMREKLTQVP